MTWSPTLPAGTKVMLSLEDANEEEAWSGEVRPLCQLRQQKELTTLCLDHHW